MVESQIFLVKVLLIASVVVLFLPFLILGIRRMVMSPSCRMYKKTGINMFFVLFVSLLGSVWCLRYAVGYFEIITMSENEATLSLWEEVFDSFLHALQTFSMDEDYTKYIITGNQMLETVFPKSLSLQAFFRVYSSLLNFISPIVGGAIIFEILASVFPKIKLRASYWAFWKEKYYFSELNEASLALAKSIRSSKNPLFRKPVIIFTDAYVDRKEERDMELFNRAKNIGSICIKDDLAHITKNLFGKRKYFLMDENELNNLQTLTELSNSYNCKFLKKAEVYFFTIDDAYIQVEKSICAKLGEEQSPIFIPIKGYRNLISNLLVEIPLYEPLIGKKEKTDLNVTVLGTGFIGTEMFLSTYWFGQILNYNLKINVISQESEEEFWGKIDYVNPEIRQTTESDNSILEYNRNGDRSPVYCKVNYIQCDAKSSEFINCLKNKSLGILDTDYFLVSLGADEINISVANTIRKYIGEYHISETSTNTIITYVVYNSELSEILNRQNYFESAKNKADIYMKAIGSLKDVYSVKNVFFPGYEPFEQEDEEAIDTNEARKQREKANAERFENEYIYWANLARKMHIKYKIFSVGLFETSLFDYSYIDKIDSDKKEEIKVAERKKYTEAIKKTYEAYKKIMLGDFDFSDKQNEESHLQMLHNMSWLEHRRWSAFTRVSGFRSTKHYNAYASVNEKGSHKHMDIKLHPCLVECDKRGIRASISTKGIIDVDSTCKWLPNGDYDYLDELSREMYTQGYINKDFKFKDYPINDFID